MPAPLLNIGSAFAGAANAAINLATNTTNTTLSPAFSPYASDVLFFHGGFIFEDVGVTAYRVRCAVAGVLADASGRSLPLQLSLAQGCCSRAADRLFPSVLGGL